MPLSVATSFQSGVSALWRHDRRKRRSSLSGFSAVVGVMILVAIEDATDGGVGGDRKREIDREMRCRRSWRVEEE